MTQKTLAILSLVFAFVFAPVGAILAIIALVQVSKSPDKTGKGMAIAALIISLILPIILLFTAFIGIIAYLGVLEPNEFLPERCTVSGPFLCTGPHELHSRGKGVGNAPTLIIPVANNFGEDLYISDIQLMTLPGLCGDYYACIDSDDDRTCNNEVNLKNDSAVLEAGNRKKILVDCAQGNKLKKGEHYAFRFKFRYYAEDTKEIAKTGTAEIYSKAS